MAKKKKKTTKYDLEVRKIKKIYQNYGINTDDMSDDEFERLYQAYQDKKSDIENDIKKSEEHSSKFNDDEIIG